MPFHQSVHPQGRTPSVRQSRAELEQLSVAATRLATGAEIVRRELAQLRAEQGRQGTEQSRIIAALADLLDGVSALYALLTAPPEQPREPRAESSRRA